MAFVWYLLLLFIFFITPYTKFICEQLGSEVKKFLVWLISPCNEREHVCYNLLSNFTYQIMLV